MKTGRIQVFIIITLLLFSQVNTKAQIPAFKTLLTQFAYNITKDSFNSNFSYENWLKKLKKISKPGQIAKHILILEKGIKHNRKKSEWDDKVKNWRKTLKNAVSLSETAYALYNFEINLKWQATTANWNKKRRIWVKRIKSFY
jgi:hypothetical protein